MPKENATSTPLSARLILVTKPNVQGGPAGKKARIVIRGNFQDVRLGELTASKTPDHPSLRVVLTKALLEKHVMKRSGSLPYDLQGANQQATNLRVGRTLVKSRGSPREQGWILPPV